MLTQLEVDVMNAIICIARAMEEQNDILAEIRDAIKKNKKEAEE